MFLNIYFEGGCVSPDMKVRFGCNAFQPIKALSIAGIQHNRITMDKATPFDYIGVSFSTQSLQLMKEASFDISQQVKYGMILADANNPPKRVKSFVAALAVVSQNKLQKLFHSFNIIIQ